MPLVVGLGLFTLVLLGLAGVLLRKRLMRLLAGIRFSLRTLVLAVLALGASGTAFLHRDPYERSARAIHEVDSPFSQPEFSPDGKQLLLISQFRVSLGDMEGNFSRQSTQPSLNFVTGAHFTDDGAGLVVFASDKVARIDLASGAQTVLADFPLEPPPGQSTFPGATVLNVSANGRYVLLRASTYVRTPQGGMGVLSNEPQRVQLYDGQEKKCVATLPFDPNGWDQAGLSADGSLVFCQQASGGVAVLMIYDWSKDQTRLVPLGQRHVFQNRLVCTQDRRMVAFANIAGGLTFVDLEHACVLEASGSRGLVSACLSPDGKALVAIDKDKDVFLWRMRRPPGAFGPLDFPELWLTIALGACLLLSLLGDLRALVRERNAQALPRGTPAPAETKTSLSKV